MTEGDSREVMDGLERAVRLYLRLAAKYLGVNRPTSCLTAYGFKLSYGQVLQNMSAVASSEDLSEAERTKPIELASDKLTRFPDSAPVDTDTAHLATKLFSMTGDALAKLASVKTVVGCAPGGEAMMISSSLGELVPAGALRLEAVLGIRGIGFGQPRTVYAH